MQEITKLETNAVTSMSDFVEIKDEKVYTTSRIVAEKFEKSHDNVLKAIESKMKFTDVNFNVSDYFVEDSYIDPTGRTLKQYLITEEGAMLLIMGFTGEKAFAVQTKFISEFKRMSRIINNPTEVIADTGSAEAVLAWSLSQIRMANVLAKQMKENKALTTTVEVQKQQIVEMKPKADYYNTVLQSNDVVPITYIAKDYGKSAIWMNTHLKDKGVQFKKGEIWLLYQKYAELGLTQSKTSNYVDKDGITHTKMHTYWTQRGRLFIYDLLKQDGILPLIEQE